MTWIPWAFLLLAFVWLLFYNSPKSIVRLGCWLVGWAEGRMEMQRVHSEAYARMIATRHIDRNVSPDQPERTIDPGPTAKQLVDSSLKFYAQSGLSNATKPQPEDQRIIITGLSQSGVQ